MSTIVLYPSQRERAQQLADVLPHCACGEILTPRGHCLNIGDCPDADRAATRQSLQRGAAASARPSAWTSSGRVD